MRIVWRLLPAIFLVMVSGFFSPIHVDAAGCNTCTVQDYPCFDEYGAEQTCYLDGCHCLQTSCPAGKYEAPNGKCYDVGSGGACACGADSSGSCLSCGGGGSECWDGAVNCPAGTVKTSTVSQTFCRNNDWGTRMCGDVGSAQAVTNNPCCRTGTDPDTGEEICLNDRITTYACAVVSSCPYTPFNAPTNVSVTQGSSASEAIVRWVNARGGTVTKFRFGSEGGNNFNDVETGCYGGTCLSPAPIDYPTYSHPPDPGASNPQQMWYYSYTANFGNGGCVQTGPTTKKATYAQCEEDLKNYIGYSVTPGICYKTEFACNQYSTKSVTVNGVISIPETQYRARVVNFYDATCYASASQG